MTALIMLVLFVALLIAVCAALAYREECSQLRDLYSSMAVKEHNIEALCRVKDEEILRLANKVKRLEATRQ